VTGAETQAKMDEVADRTAIIADRLKELYTKSVHPVEKRYQYDYFFESPFLTDVEFDGMYEYGGFYHVTFRMKCIVSYSIFPRRID